jgi:hypothetical protein
LLVGNQGKFLYLFKNKTHTKPFSANGNNSCGFG